MRGRQGADKSSGFAPIAERFRRGGDLERAVQLCREGLAQFPDHLSGRVTLGWALLDLGRYDEARTELELVLRKAPDNLAAIRGLAELHDRAESTMLLDVEAPGPWPPEGAAIEEDTAAVDVAPELPAETIEDYEKAIAPSETFAALAAAASSTVEPALDADASLEAAIADLDAQAEALVAARASEGDPPSPIVEAQGPVESPSADPLAEFAAAMSAPPAAPVVETAAITPVEIETPAAASMAEANRATEEAAAALEALEAEEGLRLAAEAAAATIVEPVVEPMVEDAAAPVVEPVVAPEPIELSAAEAAAAQHADRVADESIAAFAEAEAHAARHAASVTELTAVAPATEAEPELVRDADLMRAEAAEPPAFAAQRLDEFVQAHEASVDLAEEVAAFAAAIEPAAVEPQITRALDVQYDHAADEVPAIDLVPADAELAIAGAEKLAADLAASVHADTGAEDAPPDVHAADAFAAMQDLSSGARLIEPLTHAGAHDADDVAVDASSAFDHDVPTGSAFESDVLAAAAQAREAAASFEAFDREQAAHPAASAYADAKTEDWTPPAVQEAAPAPPLPPSPVLAAIVEAASDFVPPELAAVQVDSVDNLPETIAEVVAPAAFSRSGDTSESLDRATVYDTPVPSVETPVTPIEPAKPRRGRTTAQRRAPSPVASLEKMLRRVQARRQLVSESVA